MLQNRLIEDLLKLGLRPGGVWMVHSSLSSLGHIPGGPETVVKSLEKALGPEGTLLMPALTYNLVTPDQPVFDYSRTRSHIGVIPEYFRTRAGTLRSIHPTHSVCGTGTRAAEILIDHHLDRTPVGSHSPFRKLAGLKGQILMLGCGLQPNTAMHGIEELAPPPYLFAGEQNYTTIDREGNTETQRHTVHDFEGWEQRYDRVADILRAPALRTGKVLQAEAHLIEAAELEEKALAILEVNPLYFVDPE